MNPDQYQRLQNFPRVGILRPNMNSLYAHHHHHLQPPHGREVYMRVPGLD